MDDDWYRARGIELHDTDRGGQVTYHGPGQLVGYPIVRVDSVRDYVRALEDAIVAALADEGIEATVPDGLTGVWAGDAKIASIGVHVSRHVATHGFAVNVDADLEPFTWIRPCGADARMTSIAAEQGGGASMSCFRKRIAYRLAEALDLRARVVSSRSLHLAAVHAAAEGRPSDAAAGRDDRERSVRNGAPFAIVSSRGAGTIGSPR
jgi:lipoate-protein ligase B